MGVYTRPDSPYFWMRVEQPHAVFTRECTHIPARGLTPELRAENKRKAQQVYLTALTQAGSRAQGLEPDEARPPIRVRAYADWYETHVTATNRGAERELDILKIVRADLGALWLHDLDRARVQEWMTKRVAQDMLSPRSVNREVDLLKSMLRDACPKYLEASPIAGMRRLKVIPPRRHYMTEDEEDRIVRALKHDAVGRALLFLGIDSLCRLGDLLDLRREDDHGRYAWIQDPKDPGQAEPYTIPISTRARRALDAIPGKDAYYFARFRVAEKPRDWRGSVRQWLEKTCAAATPPVVYGRKQGGVVFHWATRRTGASRMLRHGVDLKSVQRVGNWKSADLVLGIYSETFDVEVAKAVEVPGRRRKKRKSRERSVIDSAANGRLQAQGQRVLLALPRTKRRESAS
jgi:integrase